MNDDNKNNINTPYNIMNDNNPFQNSQNIPTQSQIVQINRNQDIMYYLRQIADNTAVQRRRNEDGDLVSGIVIFLITLFMIYMGVSFYLRGGFMTTVGPHLFFMILGVFLAIILLHRQEANIARNIHCKKNNLNLIKFN